MQQNFKEKTLVVQLFIGTKKNKMNSLFLQKG